MKKLLSVLLALSFLASISISCKDIKEKAQDKMEEVKEKIPGMKDLNVEELKEKAKEQMDK